MTDWPTAPVSTLREPDHPAVKRLGPMAMSQWPADRPYPTVEEIDMAEKRMSEANKVDAAAGYMGDWGMSLTFTMATWARGCWWFLFFPDEKMRVSSGQQGWSRA